MRDWIHGYRQALAHGLLIIGPLFLLYLHGRDREQPTWMSTAASWLARPGQIVVGGMVSATSEAGGRYIWLVDVQARNEQLEAELETVKLDRSLLARRLSEADRRAQMCGFSFAREDLELLAARVVAHELGPLDQVIRIAIELPEGAAEVPPDASVITARGLVGRVAKLSGRLAEVELCTDPRARIHARAAVRGVLGTVRGVGPGDRLGLRFLTSEGQALLKEGDPVVTSGHDRRYVPGMVVGVIASEDARQEGVNLEYAVRPAVPFWQVREVFVVAGRREVEGP